MLIKASRKRKLLIINNIYKVNICKKTHRNLIKNT